MAATIASFDDLSVADKALLRLSFGRARRLEFYEFLADFIGDGLPAIDAIRIQSERAHREGSALARMFDAWIMSIRGGNTLTQSLYGWVPSEEVMFISMGESGKDLATSIRELVNLLEQRTALVNKVTAELASPVLYFFILIGVAIGLSVKVVPPLKAVIHNPAMTPTVAKIFFGISDFVHAFWPYFITLLLIATAVMVVSLPILTGPARTVVDRFPPWSWYRRLTSATFLISLSTMMRSGLPMQRALETLSLLSTPWMRHHITRMEYRLREGRNNAEVLDTGMLPEDVLGSIRDYANLKSFSEAMGKFGRRGSAAAQAYFGRIAARASLVMKVMLYGYIMIAFLSFGLTAMAVLAASQR